MINEYKTHNCKILKVEKETADSKTFTLTLPYRDFKFVSGQYLMVSIPGFGEAAISISSDMNDKKSLQLTVREVGALTSAMHKMKRGDILGIRGPYGRPFPVEASKGKNILIVVGGCGIPPIRPVILDAVKNPQKYKKVYIFYGSKSEDTLFFKREYPKWERVCDLNIALENPKTSKFSKGMVTALFDMKDIPADAVAYVCGPPLMYRFVLEKMLSKGMKPENIFMSLERHMDCGQGVCQHCAIGPYYVCKDGPVFSYAELMNFKSWLGPI
jgi:NAD(P)H-flavin reductase